ncbi:MAG: hypothetical protein ACI38Q_01155 [Candidatus Bruticola sp.]
MVKGNFSKKLGTAATCAGLCLTFSAFAAGCSDGGDTSYAPLDYAKYGTVTFSMSEAASRFSTVKYSFLNKSGLPILVTDRLAVENSLAVDQVPQEAVKVIGYYFIGDTAKSFSVDPIDWNTTGSLKTTVAANPSISDADLEYYRFDPTYTHIDKGEFTYVNLTASYLLPDSTYADLDLTPLAEIKPLGHLVMQAQDSLLNNYYQGKSYGKQEFEITSSNLANFTTTRTEDHHDYVYVSDAILTEVILKDSVNGEVDEITIFNPDTDLGLTPVTLNGKLYNVTSGEIIAIGVYTSPTTRSNDFQVQLRDREATWETPNITDINFQLGKDRVVYTARNAANNVPLKVYTYDKNNQKVGDEITINIKDAQKSMYSEYDPLIIGAVDYANLHEVPQSDSYKINFRVKAYYTVDGSETEHMPVFEKTNSGSLVVLNTNESTVVTPNETTQSYQLSAGTASAEETGELSFTLRNDEDKDLASTDTYEYKVVVAPAD